MSWSEKHLDRAHDFSRSMGGRRSLEQILIRLSMGILYPYQSQRHGHLHPDTFQV